MESNQFIIIKQQCYSFDIETEKFVRINDEVINIGKTSSEAEPDSTSIQSKSNVNVDNETKNDVSIIIISFHLTEIHT